MSSPVAGVSLKNAQANNIAMRVESANAYIANAHPGCHHDCIFLVCDTCGQVTHIDDDPITGSLRSAAEKAGFVPVRPVIEVRGTCSASRRQMRSTRSRLTRNPLRLTMTAIRR